MEWGEAQARSGPGHRAEAGAERREGAGTGWREMESCVSDSGDTFSLEITLKTDDTLQASTPSHTVLRSRSAGAPLIRKAATGRTGTGAQGTAERWGTKLGLKGAKRPRPRVSRQPTPQRRVSRRQWHPATALPSSDSEPAKTRLSGQVRLSQPTCRKGRHGGHKKGAKRTHRIFTPEESCTPGEHTHPLYTQPSEAPAPAPSGAWLCSQGRNQGTTVS